MSVAKTLFLSQAQIKKGGVTMKRILLMSVVLVALLLSACVAPATTPTPKADPEREAIITFTRQALEIESKRKQLMDYYRQPLIPQVGRQAVNWLISRTFLNGAPPNSYLDLPPTGLEGMFSLQSKLLLLDYPQSLQVIKDSLNSIYES